MIKAIWQGIFQFRSSPFDTVALTVQGNAMA